MKNLKKIINNYKKKHCKCRIKSNNSIIYTCKKCTKKLLDI